MLPAGWEERVVAYQRADAAPSHAVCVEAHDLVVSKLVAGRDKDIVFATVHIRAGLADPQILIQRAEQLPVPGAIVRRARDSIHRCVREPRQG